MVPIPLAHRGWWWPEPRRQNTPPAFLAAARAGYGLELDICMVQGRLWIAHAPADVLTGRAVCGPTGVLPALCAAPLLAWNLKIISAAEPLVEFIQKQGLADRSLVFDHELALEGTDLGPMDTGKYMVAIDCPGILTRASDREDEPLGLALVRTAHGVWLDAFEKDWVPRERILQAHAAGKAAYVVSPELHGRPLDLGLWKEWVGAGVQGICTDFPHLLAAWMDWKAPLEPL